MPAPTLAPAIAPAIELATASASVSANMSATVSARVVTIAEVKIMTRVISNCRVPSDHIPIRSWPLFLARELMRDLIETLKAEQST